VKLIDGECVVPDRRRCGLLRCTVLHLFVTVRESVTLFPPVVYLRSTLATVRAWSLDVYLFAVREAISVYIFIENMSSLFMQIHCTFLKVNDASNFPMFSNVVISQHHALCIAATEL
jgi:hypothetical protein